MSRAGDQVEKLGQRVKEVEHLGDEEQEEGLGEVSQDGHHSKGHP